MPYAPQEWGQPAIQRLQQPTPVVPPLAILSLPREIGVCSGSHTMGHARRLNIKKR